MKSLLLGLGILLVSLEQGRAEAPSKGSAGDKTVIIEIPADLPPPPSAEEVVPTHPFFAAPSTGNEVMEKIQELEDRIEKLEKSRGLPSPSSGPAKGTP